jgi:hypothetical protein
MSDLSARKAILLSTLILVVCLNVVSQSDPARVAEEKAVAFLSREVPAWSRDNGCFSCHNNGDGARALYAATVKGYRLPAAALSDTTAWVSEPQKWDTNKGDPGFSDKRLANIQFAASLQAAYEARMIAGIGPLREGARKLVADQGADGAWHIGGDNILGSPATYGTYLATVMALRSLKGSGLSQLEDAIRKSERWLLKSSPPDLISSSSLVIALKEITVDHTTRRRIEEQWLNSVRMTQTTDGGWGPYPDSPPEPFDTAMVLLALDRLRDRHNVQDLILRGRKFLASVQNGDGSWPPTTRPARGESYAQGMSTTGWATLALLATRE